MNKLDPISTICALIAESDGYLALSTIVSPSPRPIAHHFDKLSEDDKADNELGELFREEAENDGWPFLSLAQVAFDGNTPLLLISDMSDHTRNIANDNRVSLLIDGTVGENRMDSGRVALIGRAKIVDKNNHRDVYLAQHPKAKTYFDFDDFNMYTIEVLYARLNAGFGQAFWVHGDEIKGERNGNR